MRIKKATFAIAAILLAALAIIVLWRYHVEIEPLLAEGGPAGAQASSHFQIVFMLAVVALGLLLLFFMELCVFRPIANAGQIVERLINHDPDAVDTKGLGMFNDLAQGFNRLTVDLREKDAAFVEKDRNLTYRLRVEEALAKVARNLLRDSGKGIARSLRVLGRNLDTDVVSYWQMNRHGDSMRCMGTFRDSETGEFSGEYDFSAPSVDWINEIIHNERHVIIDDVSKIPPEYAKVKEFIEEYGLKSFLGVPLKVPETTLGGLVAFGNINKVRHWSKEDLRSLEVVAELLVDQIAKSDKCGDGQAEPDK